MNLFFIIYACKIRDFRICWCLDKVRYALWSVTLAVEGILKQSSGMFEAEYFAFTWFNMLFTWVSRLQTSNLDGVLLSLYWCALINGLRENCRPPLRAPEISHNFQNYACNHLRLTQIGCRPLSGCWNLVRVLPYQNLLWLTIFVLLFLLMDIWAWRWSILWEKFSFIWDKRLKNWISILVMLFIVLLMN